MRTGLRLVLLVGLLLARSGRAQDVSPKDLVQPLGASWPTYNGDYTGRRYSSLKQVNRATVKQLTLAWLSRLTPGDEAGAADRRRGDRVALIVGGEGPGNIAIRGGSIKASVLEADGILYVTMPDNVWALDAVDGRAIWHYFWKTRGGTHIGNRGVGLWHGYVFFETPDDYLVSLDARTGKERWHKAFANVEEGYFATPAPLVIGNHVLVGMGNDIDSAGYLQSFAPETGELQWKFYTVPMKKDDPGIDSWKSLDAARHGGAQVWITGAYDPETHLYFFGTGNPTPAYTTGTRGEGSNLYTCSLIALNVETGKMAWYYQTSPHDMHDYDSAQTPVLVDGMFGGRMRKMVVTAARNGYFFTLDRVTGEHLVTSRYGTDTNWAKGLTKGGEPQYDPVKNATIAGSLVSPSSEGTTNWQPPAFSPETGLLYTYEANTFSLMYLTDADPRGSMGLGGKEETHLGASRSFLTAIDYSTGKAKWRRPFYSDDPGGGGLLATAGGLVFTGDGAGSLAAYDAADGTPLWNTRIGEVSNAPQTFLLGGHQYVIAASGETLFAFLLY